VADKTTYIRNRRLLLEEIASLIRDRQDVRDAEEEQQQRPPLRHLKVGIDSKVLACGGCEHFLCQFCFMIENELEDLDGETATIDCFVLCTVGHDRERRRSRNAILSL
jgi:hypothetical protein